MLWAVLARLLVPFTIGQNELALIRQPSHCASPLKQTHGTATMSTSLSQGTGSSPTLLSSHATPRATVTVMDGQCPLVDKRNVSKLSSVCSELSVTFSEAFNPCSRLLGISTVEAGAVKVTIVCKSRESVFMTEVLLIRVLRRRQSPQ